MPLPLLSPMPSKVRVACACLCAAFAAALAAPPVASAAPATEPETRIVQYMGNEKGNELGKQSMIVYVKPAGAASSRPMQLAVPNKDNKPEYAPDGRIADAVKDLKPNDYIQVEIIPPPNRSQRATLKSVKSYTPREGELEPNVYIFMASSRRQEGGRDFIGVVLMKLGETIVAAVPMLKTESGGMVPDEKMIASFETFKKDQPVEVEFSSAGRPPTIATIDPYAQPESATFVKMTEVDIDGQKADAMELTVKGKPVTAILSGKMLGKKWVPQPKLASLSKKLKPDQEVTIRLVNDGDKTWVRYFDIDKKPAAAGDDKTAAKDEQKADEKKGPAKK